MKNRQGITIAALIVAIIGLSIGFAAFSNTLNISSTASVNPDASNLKVVFANNTDVNNLNTNPVQVYSASQGASGTQGTINNEALNGPTLTGLKASFTAPGQSVVYKLNVVNAGKLKAYLTDIVFGTTGNPAKTVSCTVATKDSNNQDIPVANQATDSLVQSACNGISISVKIGELDAKTASGSLNNLELNVAGYKEVVITISYASGSAYVDGPMNVAFGDIEINAASVGTQQSSPSSPSEQEDYSDVFVSYSQGELSNYIGSDTDVEIPSGLMLPVTTAIYTYNEEGCINTIIGLGMFEEGQESNAKAYCDSNVASAFSAGPNDTLIMTEADMNQMAPDFTSMKDYISTFSSSVTDTKYPITNIGSEAFKDKGLTSIEIDSTITTIGTRAFYNNKLSSVVIPSSVTTIGDSAFENNRISILDLSNATSLATIDSGAFDGNSLTTLVIPSSVTTLGSYAFGDHTNTIDNVTYQNSLTSVTMYPTKQVLGSQIVNFMFGYDPNANCENNVNSDFSSNSCITWVNG